MNTEKSIEHINNLNKNNIEATLLHLTSSKDVFLFDLFVNKYSQHIKEYAYSALLISIKHDFQHAFDILLNFSTTEILDNEHNIDWSIFIKSLESSNMYYIKKLIKTFNLDLSESEFFFSLLLKANLNKENFIDIVESINFDFEHFDTIELLKTSYNDNNYFRVNYLFQKIFENIESQEVINISFLTIIRMIKEEKVALEFLKLYKITPEAKYTNILEVCCALKYKQTIEIIFANNDIKNDLRINYPDLYKEYNKKYIVGKVCDF